MKHDNIRNDTTVHQAQNVSPFGLHLMTLIPDPSFEQTLYTLDMSCELHNALLDLTGLTEGYKNLNTYVLRTQLAELIDEPVYIAPINLLRNQPIESWIVAASPLNLERLSLIISNWVLSLHTKAHNPEEHYPRIFELLETKQLAMHTHTTHTRLFNDEGQPLHNLAFAGFSLAACNAVVGELCHLSCGTDLRFERIMMPGSSLHYQLMSQVLWHQEYPYAILLDLSVQTVAPNRTAHLNVKASVRRFIHDPWSSAHGKPPFLEQDVHAHIRRLHKPWHQISYGYNAQTRKVTWNSLGQKNLKDCTGIELPKLEEYLQNMSAWAHESSDLQIVSPLSLTTKWAKAHKVETGLSLNDKAELFEFVAKRLQGLAAPYEIVDQLKFVNHKARYDTYGEDPNELLAWQQANRQRLKQATGSSYIQLECIGTSADALALAYVRKEFEHFLGPAGTADGVTITITTILDDAATAPLTTNNGSEMRLRIHELASRYQSPPQGVPCGCIVMLPDYRNLKKGNQVSRDQDPKEALRMGFAQAGRVTQFLVPPIRDPKTKTPPQTSGQDTSHDLAVQPGDPAPVINDTPMDLCDDPLPDAPLYGDTTFTYRVCSAVRDLMRQLGFIFDFKSRPQLKDAAPLYGVHVYSAPRKYARALYLIATKLNYETGETWALIPQIGDTWIPYWQGLLELARDSSRLSQPSSQPCDGNDLARLIDRITAEAPQDALLIVNAKGPIRTEQWWPGICDINIVRGPLRYGPTKCNNRQVADMLYDPPRNNLHILRVRTSSDGEVPDYYTDPSDNGRKSRQGIFRLDGYWLALAPSLGDGPYKSARRESKFTNPHMRFVTKTLNEYYLLTKGDMDVERSCVLRAEASRGNLVQLLKSDMKVNLPAPLHLAVAMDEYIWKRPQRS